MVMKRLDKNVVIVARHALPPVGPNKLAGRPERARFNRWQSLAERLCATETPQWRYS